MSRLPLALVARGILATQLGVAALFVGSILTGRFIQAESFPYLLPGFFIGFVVGAEIAQRADAGLSITEASLVQKLDDILMIVTALFGAALPAVLFVTLVFTSNGTPCAFASAAVVLAATSIIYVRMRNLLRPIDRGEDASA